jgi:hypothetical protein
MIGESFYYINNKKYLGKSSSMVTALAESPWSGDQSRSLVLVAPEGHSQVQQSYIDTLLTDYPNANPDMITFTNTNEINTWEYLSNNDKEFLLFDDAFDIIDVYAKYIASLLKTTTSGDVKQIVKDFLKLVFKRDIEYATYTHFTLDDVDARVESVFAKNEWHDMGTPNSKHWGYDILFFINDRYNQDETYAEINAVTQNHLREKFTVHSEKMIFEVISMLQTKIGYISVINNIIDWMHSQDNNNWDKVQFVKDTFQNKNRMQALYVLRDFWDEVGNNAELMSIINNHEDWEYEDVYNEFARTIPVIIKVAEGGFNFATNEELSNVWKEVEFFYKRKSRIPYLLFNVAPLVSE